MEWTGAQQLLFLLRSVGVGMFVGLLFDVMCGIERTFRRRFMVFVWDGLFGVVAAWITFFASLSITDGKMHPLLFCGIGFGFVAEHGGVGVYVSKGVSFASRWVSRMACSMLTVVDAAIVGFVRFLVFTFFEKGK